MKTAISFQLFSRERPYIIDCNNNNTLIETFYVFIFNSKYNNTVSSRKQIIK